MDTENQNLSFGAEESHEEAVPEGDIEIIADDSGGSSAEFSEGGEAEQQEETEQKPKKKKNEASKLKVNQLMRDKYQLEQERNIIAEERNRLMQENASLKQLNDFSTKAAITNYETSTLDRLDRAKNLKAQAYESGDIKAQVDADISLNMALNEYERLEKWKGEQNLRVQQQEFDEKSQQQQQFNQQQYYQNQQAPVAPNVETASQWVQENDWFVEESQNYDPDLRRFTEDLTNSMDAYLYRAGMQHGIYSPEYFEYLDNEVEKFKSGQYDHMRTQPKQQRQQSQYQQQSRNQYMSAPKSVTSGVSNSGYRTNAAVNNRKQVKLNQEEMEFANRMSTIPGVSAEDYARHVLHDRQTAHLRQNRR